MVQINLRRLIKKVTPEDFGQAEGEVAVGDGLEDFFTEPLPEFYHPLLMAGGAELKVNGCEMRSFRIQN